MYGMETQVQATESNVTSGACGENLTWILEDGVMTISGTGKMDDFWEGSDDQPCWNTEKIKSVIVKDGVCDIGIRAFDFCVNLKSVILPESVTGIGKCAFQSCYNLTSINIPSGVTYIGDSAFSSCEKLDNINIPNGVTYIGDYAFSGCDKLDNILNIPDGITSISEGMFYGCDGLTNITIPSHITKIKYNAFSGCNFLETVVIGENVTEVGKWAFCDCGSLKSIKFLGNAPSRPADTELFGYYHNPVIIYYPPNNSTWTGNVKNCIEDSSHGDIFWRESGRCDNVDNTSLLHDWEDPIITFSEDGKKATAVFYCENNPEHVYTMDATVTSRIALDATCVSKGTTKYVATAEYHGAQGSAIKYMENIEIKKTHNWEKPIISFSEDGKTATAVFYCKYDKSHIYTMVVKSQEMEKLQPTCSSKGVTEYMVTVTYEGVTGTATTELTDIPELEHSWDDGVVTVTPNTEHDGVITYTCSVCQIIRTEVLPKLQDANNSGTKHPAGNTGITDTVSNNASTGTAGNTANSTNNTETDTGAEDIQVGSVITEDSSDVKYKVITIGRNPAVECVRTTDKNLKNLVIPSSVTIDGVTYKVTAIADNAFKNCKKLTTVRIGTNVSRIGKRAFNGCKNLKSVKINSKKLTKKSIGTSAFKGISSKAVIKVPKSKLKTYKSYLKKSGVNGKKQTIKRS